MALVLVDVVALCGACLLSFAGLGFFELRDICWGLFSRCIAREHAMFEFRGQLANLEIAFEAFFVSLRSTIFFAIHLQQVVSRRPLELT